MLIIALRKYMDGQEAQVDFTVFWLLYSKSKSLGDIRGFVVGGGERERERKGLLR